MARPSDKSRRQSYYELLNFAIFLVGRTSWRGANELHHARALLLAPHGYSYLHYRNQMLVVHAKFPDEKEAKKPTSTFSREASRICLHRHSRPLAGDGQWKQIHCLNSRVLLKADGSFNDGDGDGYKASNIFIEDWLSNFVVPSTVLKDNSPQITFNFFVTSRNELYVKTVTTTEYHPQANRYI